jgi:transcriptional regulator with XRE-family HTH domain
MSLNLFGEKIKEILKANSWSQQKLADMMEVTQQTVSRWIKGRRQPDFDTLLRLCYILKEEPNELLGFNDLTENDYKEYIDYNYTAIVNNYEYQKYLDEQDDEYDMIMEEQEARRKAGIDDYYGDDIDNL